MKEFNLTTGRKGEEIARQYLKDKGYKIIQQNYRTKYGETDLIAQKKNDIIFIEVRTKKGEDFGTPEESLNKRKMRKLWGNAVAYTGRMKWRGSYRIDAICIVLNQNGSVARLNHYENII